MEQSRGPWVVLRSIEVYRDTLIRVSSDDVTQPDGRPGRYATVSVEPGGAVLPIDGCGIVYLNRRFRSTLGAERLEACCGCVVAGESRRRPPRRKPGKR